MVFVLVPSELLSSFQTCGKMYSCMNESVTTTRNDIVDCNSHSVDYSVTISCLVLGT